MSDFVVAGKLGARVRAGPALDTEKVTDLPVGTSVVVVETRDSTTDKCTTTRARLSSPCVGWCSLKTLSPKGRTEQDVRGSGPSVNMPNLASRGPGMEEDVISAALLAYALLEAEAKAEEEDGDDDESDGFVIV